MAAPSRPLPRSVSPAALALLMAVLWVLTAAGVAWLGLPADIVAPSGLADTDHIV